MYPIPSDIERGEIPTGQRLSGAFSMVLPLLTQLRDRQCELIGSIPGSLEDRERISVLIQPYYTNYTDHRQVGVWRIRIENGGSKLDSYLTSGPSGVLVNTAVKREQLEEPSEDEKSRVASVLEVLAHNLSDLVVEDTESRRRRRSVGARFFAGLGALCVKLKRT